MTENRETIWHEYIAQGGEPHRIVRHMFKGYSRYFEASLISQWFIDNLIELTFPILDYGCGVGDYGIYLLRAGAIDVDFYDFPRSVKFVDFRLKREGLTHGNTIDADEDKVILKDYDFIIFGEVLEHLDNPLGLLQKVIANKTAFIFTSSYPYRTDDPEDPYWSNHNHDSGAREQQPACRELLEKHYDYEKFDGELRLWHKK